MENTKSNIANLIIESSKIEEKYCKRVSSGRELYQLRKILGNMLDFFEETKLEEIKETMQQNIENFSEMITVLQKQMVDLPSKEKLDSFNNDTAKKYLELVALENKEKPFHDVLFCLNSRYEYGSKTLRNIVDFLNKKGANIEIVYEKQREEQNKNDNFLLLMPSTSYVEFNKLINKDHSDSKNDIIGERRYYFYLNNLNQDFSIDEIKKDLMKNIRNQGDPLDLFFKKFGSVCNNLPISNYNSENNIVNTIIKTLSEINKFEDKMANYQGITPLKDAIELKNREIAEQHDKNTKYITSPKLNK